MMEHPAPKDAAFAREIIIALENEIQSKAAKIDFAKGVIQLGNYTEEGMAVWLDYYDHLTWE